jgi:lipopolysaccharide/colanic/teichoic acid biosynthesis glycosyltransferase
MSLVGSLPIAASNLEDLKNHRFKNISIKPGLTGDWRFGDRRKLDDGEYLADLNENYINKWSLARDCWIILKTIGLILTRKPASLQVSLFSCLEDNRDYSVKSA